MVSIIGICRSLCIRITKLRFQFLFKIVLVSVFATGFIRTAHCENIDLALVLAVDVSYSMDEDEQRLQRLGYISAITDPNTLNAIKSGRFGKIAVSYVEWAGTFSQVQVVDWHVIEDLESAEAFAAQLVDFSVRKIYRTSISSALAYSADLFTELDHDYNVHRRTIDISGDGPNNQGPLVTEIRDWVLSRRISINGLPLMLKRPEYSWFDIPNLDEYYEKCVIGGPSSFSIPVRNVADFNKAIRMKMVLEIASLLPSWYSDSENKPQYAAATEENLCTIGERLWRDRMRFFDVE